MRGGGTGRAGRGREPWKGLIPGMGLGDRSQFRGLGRVEGVYSPLLRHKGPSLSSSGFGFFFFLFLSQLEAERAVVVFCIIYSNSIQPLLCKVFDT